MYRPRRTGAFPVAEGVVLALTSRAKGITMKKAAKPALLAIVLLPGVTWAGTLNRLEVPTLGEAGMITLGVALMGAGVVAIRRKKR